MADAITSRHLVDPELLPALEAFPAMDLGEATIPALRALIGQMSGAMPLPAGAAVSDVTIPGGDATDVRALLIVPDERATPAPAILHMHGGAYVLGQPEMDLPRLVGMAVELGCVILSVDYRLAPETPFPGPIEDCYAALGWFHAEAGRLGIDRQRIAVMGESAGGGLAASLALLARDRGEHGIAFQLLDAPTLDDRSAVGPLHPFAGQLIFTRESSLFGWRSLLGTEPGGPHVSPYAAAARAEDLSGLPATFIATGALDRLVDEDIVYAQRLARAGVPIELHVYPGCPHGFSLAADATVAKKAAQDKLDALRKAFATS